MNICTFVKGLPWHTTDRLKSLYIKIFGMPFVGGRIRLYNVKKIIYKLNKEYDFSPMNILDAGCGVGTYSFYFSKKFPNAKILSIDFDREIIEKNKRSSKFPNIEFIHGDLTKLNFKDEIDLIICIDVLEHIGNDESVIENFYNALNKDGFLIIHVPKFPKDFTHLVEYHYQDDHVRDGYTESQIIKKLERRKFKIVKALNTFNYFSSLAWDIAFICQKKNKTIFAVIFPFLLIISRLDELTKRKKGNGILVHAMKRE